MDFSKISTEDLQHIQNGEYDKVSTPGLQEFHNQVSADQAQPQQASYKELPGSVFNPPETPTDKLKGILFGGEHSTLAKAQARGEAEDAAKTPQQRQAEYSDYKANLPSGLVSAASMMAPVGEAPAVARPLINGGISATSAYLAPGTSDEKRDRALKAFLIGAGISGAAELGSAALSRGADKTMQVAVGGKVDKPGMGTRMMDEGLWGTKARMARQATDKLADAESQVNSSIDAIPGTFDNSEVSAPISQINRRYAISNGEIPASEMGNAEKVQSAVDSVDNLKQGQGLTARDILKLKRQGDERAYTNAGDVANSLSAEIGKTQADAARSTLSQAAEDASQSAPQGQTIGDVLQEQGIKTPANAAADAQKALSREQTLLTAKRTLDKPDKLQTPSLAGAFFSKIPGSSIGLSSAAHAMRGAGGLSSWFSDPIMQQVINQELIKAFEDKQGQK